MAKFCSECGAQLDDDAVFCGECGTRVEVKSEIKTVGPVIMSEFTSKASAVPPDENISSKEKESTDYEMEKRKEFVCPNCHSDQIQRFEVAYTSGLADTSSTTVSGGVLGMRVLGIGGAVSKTKGTSQTVLSAKTAPPSKKGYIKSPLIVGLIVGAIAGGVLNSEIAFNIGFLLSAGYKVYKAYDFNNNIWPGMMERWRNSYICSRCGNTFVL